ncbi:HNH endonuclease [Maricaulis parjimensis]|uniref:HNH endonuclease n=1 Tax=Maricaulis parjimensis TaxID=144023 RepID=UPI0019397897|nr:HNH endonuclease signature motif containing protein [Maricaulis parjimensis]
MDFVLNREYSRKEDIHEIFGGQQQGGISTPKSHPYVFLFTGGSGTEYGYADEWIDEDCFSYTGQGQVGDMEFVRGNQAIRDHLEDGKALLLFERMGKGRPVVFRGQFFCQSWRYFQGQDVEGNLRQSIQFHLIRLGTEWSKGNRGDSMSAQNASKPLGELRGKALAVGTIPVKSNPEVASRNYYERSAIVRDYVLARANGVCELTGRPAPFFRKDGSPYLEVHHTRMVSDEGPDHPLYVAAIHPAAHREIHYGINGEQLNQELVQKIARIESALSESIDGGMG